jgi:hypothetical protein
MLVKTLQIDDLFSLIIYVIMVIGGKIKYFSYLPTFLHICQTAESERGTNNILI